MFTKSTDSFHNQISTEYNFYVYQPQFSFFGKTCSINKKNFLTPGMEGLQLIDLAVVLNKFRM